MLFDKLFANSAIYHQHDYEQTKMMKLGSNNLCIQCRKIETPWLDVTFQLPTCSEECNRAVWDEFDRQSKQPVFYEHMNRYSEQIKFELSLVNKAVDKSKDIIIVVKDQLDYLKTTISSIMQTTANYKLYVWDNNSLQPTQDYLKNLSYELGDRITVMRSDANLGFIYPNNEMASWGQSDYIILLNSDVKVMGGWDKSMLGLLQDKNDVKLVGHMGGLLDENGVGGRIGYGYDIDYIPGWCLCMERKTYNEFGLFNKDLNFAYAEDSDLSLRIQEAGYKIYALHLMFVHHFENKTVNEVREKDKTLDLVSTFQHNHDVLRKNWSGYLKSNRVDTRVKVMDDAAFKELMGNLE